MTIHAYEIDGGPSGRWWELDDDSKPEAEGFMGTEATREMAERRGATVFHTYEQWERENP